MEKMTYGLAFLALLYMVFFYWTIKSLWEDIAIKLYTSNRQKTAVEEEVRSLEK